jgi:hypothetical protein
MEEYRPYHPHHHRRHRHHHHLTILQATRHSALFTPRIRLKNITTRFILRDLEANADSQTTVLSTEVMNVIWRERLFEKEAKATTTLLAAKVSITLLEAKASTTGAFLEANPSITGAFLEAKASITLLEAKVSNTLLGAPERILQRMRLQITTGYPLLASPCIEPRLCRTDTTTSVLEIGNMTIELRKAIFNNRQIHFRPPCRSNLADGKAITSTSMAAVFQ